VGEDVRATCNCRIPYMDDANPTLGRWVTKQRGAFKMDRMDRERMDRLDQLQFTWDMKGNP
jgi:hypothetical protein